MISCTSLTFIELSCVEYSKCPHYRFSLWPYFSFFDFNSKQRCINHIFSSIRKGAFYETKNCVIGHVENCFYFIVKVKNMVCTKMNIARRIVTFYISLSRFDYKIYTLKIKTYRLATRFSE